MVVPRIRCCNQSSLEVRLGFQLSAIRISKMGSLKIRWSYQIISVTVRGASHLSLGGTRWADGNTGVVPEHNMDNQKTSVLEATMGELEDDVGVITQEIETMDSQVNFMEDESVQSLDEFLKDIKYETWVSKSNRKKQTKKGRGIITVAIRTSSRVPKDGRSMMEKSTQHAKERNEIIKGTNNANHFLILNNLSNEYIKNVTDNQLEVFRAEERVRAALAEANYKEYLASTNRKTAPQGDEELQEFSLKVVDNSARGIADPSNLVSSKIPPKRREDLGKATNEAPFLEC
jgi:hypothetical protein